MKRVIALFLALAVLCLPVEARRRWIPKIASGGAPTNNVTVIQATGNNANSSNTILIASINPVVAGNSLLVGVVALGANTFSAAGVTKPTGTATIGTVTMSQHHDAASGSDSATAIFIIPITGSGSIEIQIVASASTFLIAGVVEAHNLNATPFDVASSNSGTGTTHTTGTVTTAGPGIIMYAASEQASTNFTRTYSGTRIFSIDTGSIDYTGCVQYTLNNTTSTTMTDTTGTDSSAWIVGFSAYKSN